MDDEYKEKTFAPQFIDQLLGLTKQLDGWLPASNETDSIDYYQYLTFKIKEGNVIEIMP